MIRLVTFADNSMSKAAELCVQSAKDCGIDAAQQVSGATFRTFSPFYERNKQLLDKPRGYGYWAWKPHIIQQMFFDNGDILIYADAGIEFIGNVNEIISRMDQPIWLFGNNWEHAHWCKRDVVEQVMSKDVMPDYTHWAFPVPWQFFGKQAQASVIFFRVSDYTRRFVAEWLDWCLFEGGRLIDDSPSRTPNHPEFREHRHDQAILTTMAYRDGLRLHWWPASYNDGAFIYEKLPEYAGDDYPVLFNHHRRRNHEWAKCA